MKKIFIAILPLILFLALPVTALAASTTFANSGTWTAPIGVYSVQVEAWGDGGAGGGNNSSTRGGGGGSAGAYAELDNFPVTPGNTYAVTVGQGGIGVAGGTGGAGIGSMFDSTSTLFAHGGSGGTTGGGGSGSASTLSTGNFIFTGAAGGASVAATANGGGGGGAGGTFTNGTTGSAANVSSGAGGAGGTTGGGTGGTGGASGTAGSVGNTPGGGGAGAGEKATSIAGGNGAPGEVIINYSATTYDPTTPQIFSGRASVYDTSNTAYMVQGERNLNSFTTISTSTGAISPIAGTFSNLYAYTDNAATTNWTFTLNDNTTDTSLTCQITSSHTSCSDTADTFTIHAGDLWAIEVTRASQTNVTPYFSIKFTPTTANQTMLTTSSASVFSNTADNFVAPWFFTAPNGSSSGAGSSIFADRGTLSALSVAATSSPSTGTYNVYERQGFTVSNAQATSTLTCGLTSTANCSDLSDATSTGFGTYMTFGSEPISTPSTRALAVSSIFTPTITGNFEINAVVTFLASATRYFSVGNSGAFTVEASSSVYVQPMVVTGIVFHGNTGIGAGATGTITLDDNGTPTAAVCTVQGSGSAPSAASCWNSGFAVPIYQGDKIDFVVTGSSGAGGISGPVTLSAHVLDTAPVISSIASSTGQTAATITWTTDKSANSMVVYGTTTAYGSASSTATLLTSHSIILSGLSSATTYHYAVVSADSLGTTATSSDQTFTTASSGGDTQAPTQPTNLAATPASSSQINLSWTASTDNVGVTGYKIFRDGMQVATDTSGTTFNDTGLAVQSLHSYAVSAYDAAGNVSTSSATLDAQSQYGVDQYGTLWKPLRVGAGGFIRGMDIAPDGTMVAHTDTYGAYVWDGTQWDQLVSTSTMPANTIDVNTNGGVYEIRVAPSNSNVFYMTFQNCSGCVGGVFKTTNRGATWTKTNFTPTNDAYSEANGTYGGYGQKMAIDPANPNVVYVGTESAGVWVTADGGATWTNIASTTIPYGPATTGIAFDPSSGTTGGKTNTIYVSSVGNGVYRSTNAGVSWALLSGGPTQVNNAIVASSTYFATDGSSAWKYSGGAWTNMLTDTAEGIQSIAVDPANSLRLVVGTSGGGLNYSNDGGATWTGTDYIVGTRVATDIPWLAWTNEKFMTNGNMIFDPAASNKLYFAEGIGVWWSNPPTTPVAYNWNSQNTGIEQLVTDQIVVPPGGAPIVASWDRPVFRISNPDTFPLTHGPSNAVAISRGFSADYASNNPSFIVVSTDQNGTIVSNDGGLTWTATAGSAPSGYGGVISAASSTDMVWAPFDANPAYTTNGGATWTTVSGVTSGGWAPYLNRNTLTADRVNIGTFYFYNDAGVFKSTDGGATWTEVETGELNSFDWYSSKLESVPGKAGNLFYTAGQASPDSDNSPSGDPFLHSTDGGATWTAIPNVLEVKAFGFGAPAAGTTTPAIYIDGWVNSHYGIYRSVDGAQSWTQIGLWPIHSLDGVTTISGDMDTFGRVYVGFGGSGSAYGDTSDAAAWLSMTAPTTNSVVNGTSVTLAATTTSNVAITSVQFKVDNTNINSAITSAPYTTTWNSNGVADGTHTLSAVSLASNGKYATSSVTVSVQNAGPAISAISSGSPLQSSATVTWTTNNTSNSKVVYGTSASYGSASSSAAFVTSHSIGITGLATSTTYHYAVVSTDTLGNTSTSSDQTFTTTAPDTTPPSTPTGLSATAVSQSEIDLSWTASTDNVAVAGYQIFRGGIQVATSTGTGTTYDDTALLPTTGYTYVVKAYDAQLNISASSTPSTATTQAGIAFSATASPPLQSFGYGIEPVTFSNMNIGAATSSRTVVVGVLGELPPSMTIGGISATLATTTGPDAGSFNTASIWYASVPTGTTATIVLGSTVYNEIGIQVASMVGANPTPTSVATLGLGYKQQSDMHITATVPSNGVGVVFASESNPSAIPSWTDAIGDSYTNDAPNYTQIMFAHTYAAGSQTPSLSSANGSSYDNNDGGMVMVTWGP